MLFEEMMQDEREVGRAEGRIEGEEAVFDRLNRLVHCWQSKNAQMIFYKSHE